MDSTRAPVTRSYHVKPPGSAALNHDHQDGDEEEYVYEDDDDDADAMEHEEASGVEGPGQALSVAAADSEREREMVEPEPAVGTEGAVKVSLKLLFAPDNKQSTVVVRRFRADSPVSQLFTYVASLLPAEHVGKKFDLLTGFPRASLLPLMVQTIGEAGLAGSQIMMTWES